MSSAYSRLAPGLSPRTRGNRLQRVVAHVPGGSIPANAGEPVSTVPRHFLRGVYPRERGGTLFRLPLLRLANGLSPRTRGNPRQQAVENDSHENSENEKHIDHDAHRNRAGRNMSIVAAIVAELVYPRERGGTVLRHLQIERLQGLSPRTRGNRAEASAVCFVARSIPANAGEPCRAAGWTWARRVYPRERGGTSRAQRVEQITGGLSPRTRGNL